MVSVCTVPARGGRSCEHFGGYKTINRIPLPSINKTVLRVCALYASSCSGISPGGLKWFLYVQCLLGEEGRVSTSVDTRL